MPSQDEPPACWRFVALDLHTKRQQAGGYAGLSANSNVRSLLRTYALFGLLEEFDRPSQRRTRHGPVRVKTYETATMRQAGSIRAGNQMGKEVGDEVGVVSPLRICIVVLSTAKIRERSKRLATRWSNGFKQLAHTGDSQWQKAAPRRSAKRRNPSRTRRPPRKSERNAFEVCSGRRHQRIRPAQTELHIFTGEQS